MLYPLSYEGLKWPGVVVTPLIGVSAVDAFVFVVRHSFAVTLQILLITAGTNSQIDQNSVPDTHGFYSIELRKGAHPVSFLVRPEGIEPPTSWI